MIKMLVEFEFNLFHNAILSYAAASKYITTIMTKQQIFDDKIDCLVKRMCVVTQIRWLRVFARDQLFNASDLLKMQSSNNNNCLFALLFTNLPASEHGQQGQSIYLLAGGGSGGSCAFE